MRGLKPLCVGDTPGNVVAPPAGAWIETMKRGRFLIRGMSHPPRVRGLKRLINPLVNEKDIVAPPVGAWIETKNTRLCSGGLPAQWQRWREYHCRIEIRLN